MKKKFGIAMTAMLLMALGFTSCSSEKPSDVVMAYLNAVKEEKFDEAMSYMEGDEDDINRFSYHLRSMSTKEIDFYKEGKVTILEEEIDGEKARVKVSIETEDDSDRDNYYLNKVDGKWKIHL